MDLSTYIIVVGVVALIYGGILKVVQSKMMNKKEMDEMQKESKRMSEEYKNAINAKDNKRAEKIMKEQMGLIGKMNKKVFKQFGVVIVLFIIFTTAIGFIDPTVKDDVTIEMNDAGQECDSESGDGIYTACYPLSEGNYGKWTTSVHALSDGAEVAKMYDIFYYVEEVEDDYVEKGVGNVSISLDKKV